MKEDYLFIRNLLILLTGLFLMGSCSQNNEGPWETIFNGHDLEGWKVVGNTGIVQVADSMIICNQIPNTRVHTFVCSEKKYSDFILEMDIKTDSTCNSGILLRSFDAPLNCDTCFTPVYGYQLKLDSRLQRQWTGGIFYDYGKTWRWLYSLENDERARLAHKVGDWDHFRIEAIGSSIKVWVNGIPVTNLLNSDLSEGFIAIKIHWMPDLPEEEVKFGRYKNIRIITENPEQYAQQMDIPPRKVN